MEPGYAYRFDNSFVHEVHNPSAHDRVHLIFDTVGSPKLFNLIRNSEVVVDGPKKIRKFDGFYASMLYELHQRPTDTEIKIKASEPGDKLPLLTESWKDFDVFTPMPPKQLQRNLQQVLTD